MSTTARLDLTVRQLRNMPGGNLLHNRDYIADDLEQSQAEIEGEIGALNGEIVALESKVENLTIDNDILNDQLLEVERERQYAQMEADCLSLAFSRTIAKMLAETNPQKATDIAAMAGMTIRYRVIEDVMNRFLTVAREVADEISRDYNDQEDA